MAERVTAAMRRRERRLRSMLRHEQIANSSRGQKTATVIREVEEQDTYEAPRRQKTLPPKARPGILAEPGPQRSDRTVRRSALDTLPTLGLPILAGVSGEVVGAPPSSQPRRWKSLRK